jgi:hypothetical protein
VNWFSVTRLGDFSLGSFLKITEKDQIFGGLFSTVEIMYSFCQKNRLGYILGIFINSSGHPEADARQGNT